MASVRQYQELIVWKLAHELCTDIYRLVRSFPAHERFALSSELRRAAYSVPMNLVAGNSEPSAKQKLESIRRAENGINELDYQLMLSVDLGYIDPEEMKKMQSLLRRVGFLLSRFRLGVQRREQKAPRVSFP